MDLREIEEAIISAYGNNGSWHDVAWDDEAKTVKGLGIVVLQEQFGGEGDGDEAYIVVKVTNEDGDKYYRKNGYHASFSGTYYDGDFEEVKPVVRPVTFWE